MRAVIELAYGCIHIWKFDWLMDWNLWLVGMGGRYWKSRRLLWNHFLEFSDFRFSKFEVFYFRIGDFEVRVFNLNSIQIIFEFFIFYFNLRYKFKCILMINFIIFIIIIRVALTIITINSCSCNFLISNPFETIC